MGVVNYTPRDWTAGLQVTDAHLDTDIRDPWTNAQAAFTSYTPSWTAATTNPTLGNGTLTGAYHRVGKWITADVRLAAGSTTTAGSGIYSFTIPVAALLTTNNLVGHAWLFDSGTAHYIGACIVQTSTTFQVVTHSSTTSWGSAGSPMVIANGDLARFNLRYEAA